MKPECEAAVRAIAGERKLTKGDFDAIDERLHAQMKTLRREDPQAWAQMSPAERLQAGAKAAREQHLNGIAEAHAASIRRAQIVASKQALYDAMPAGKQLDAIDADTFMSHGASHETPLENKINAMRTERLSATTGADERFLEDPTHADALAMEAAGQHSGDAEARAVTERWQALNKRRLDRARRAGIPISERSDWRSPQPWDWARIPDKETFVRKMLGWINRGEYMEADGSPMSEARLRHTLEAAWVTLKSNGANKRAEQARGGGYGQRTGGRYNAPRQIHFKDGASWLAAMREMGTSDNLRGILSDHWRRMERDIAIAETHGSHADLDFRTLVARGEMADKLAAKTEKQARKAERKARALLQKWDVLTRGNAPGNAQVASIMGAIRSVMSASKLGVLATQQPSDAAMSLNFLRLIGMKTGHFAQDFAAAANAKGERAYWLRAAAAWADSAHDQTTRFGETEVWNRASRFLNKTVYVRSGMRALDRMNTGAIAGSYYGTLGEHIAAGHAFADLPKASRDFLAHHGFDGDTWDVLRIAGAADAFGDGRHVFNPADIHNLDDARLKGMAEKRVAAGNEELQGRIRQLNDASAREREWTAGRATKLRALRERVAAAIKTLEAKESVRAGHAEGVGQARAEVLRAHLEGLELENQFHADMTAGQAFRAGRNIGSRRATVDARIKAAETALAAKEKAAGTKIDKAAHEGDKRIGAMAKELGDFAKEMRSRSLRRQELADAYQKQVGRAVADETQRIKDETLTNVLGAYDGILHVAGRGYSHSSINERHRMQLDKFESGTLPGEALRMFYMIRQVPFGLFMTHMIDVPRGMNGWGPRANYILKYMLGQAVATGIAVQLKHIIAGEDPEDMATWKYAGKVLTGAGVGPLLEGLISPLIFGSEGEHHDVLGALLGPGAEVGSQAVQLLMASRDALGSEKDVDWGKLGSRWVSLARRNVVPFGNFWYTKAAVNHLMYQQLQEAVDPGYNERMQQRAEKRGVTRWWQQGEALPERAPDLGAATGQSAQ